MNDDAEPARGTYDRLWAVGHGYDVHRLVPGRPLYLGGVFFEYPVGLDGHSDADVILHAVMDALLGAAGMGDIGHYFPNTKEEWKDTSSLDLLERVAIHVAGDGWRVGNIDVTVIAEAPRLIAHVPEMRRNIAGKLAIDESQVNVKATTAEGMGPEGRGEAVSAHAVALLHRW